MTLTLTCRRCDEVLTADSEEELATLGEEHALQHGHAGMAREAVLARIRRHTGATEGGRTESRDEPQARHRPPCEPSG